MRHQSPHPGPSARTDAPRAPLPGEDPGTLMDEDYLGASGPDALDAAAPQSMEDRAEERIDAEVNEGFEAHADSTVESDASREASGVEGNDSNDTGGDPERILRP